MRLLGDKFRKVKFKCPFPGCELDFINVVLDESGDTPVIRCPQCLNYIKYDQCQVKKK